MKDDYSFKIFIILIILINCFIAISFININLKYIKNDVSEIKTTIVDVPAAVKPIVSEQTNVFSEPKEDTSTNISDEDIMLLKRLVFAEAGNEPIEGMAQVFFCVLNRAASGSIDFNNVNTIEDVIYQQTVSTDGHITYQFSCIPTNNFQNVKNIEARWFTERWDEMIKGCNDGTYMNNGNLFYCRNYCNSWHMQNLQYIETIGLHEFYKYLEE